MDELTAPSNKQIINCVYYLLFCCNYVLLLFFAGGIVGAAPIVIQCKKATVEITTQKTPTKKPTTTTTKPVTAITKLTTTTPKPETTSAITTTTTTMSTTMSREPTTTTTNTPTTNIKPIIKFTESTTITYTSPRSTIQRTTEGNTTPQNQDADIPATAASSSATTTPVTMTTTTTTTTTGTNSPTTAAVSISTETKTSNRKEDETTPKTKPPVLPTRPAYFDGKTNDHTDRHIEDSDVRTTSSLITVTRGTRAYLVTPPVVSSSTSFIPNFQVVSGESIFSQCQFLFVGSWVGVCTQRHPAGGVAVCSYSLLSRSCYPCLLRIREDARISFCNLFRYFIIYLALRLYSLLKVTIQITG